MEAANKTFAREDVLRQEPINQPPPGPTGADASAAVFWGDRVAVPLWFAGVAIMILYAIGTVIADLYYYSPISLPQAKKS